MAILLQPYKLSLEVQNGIETNYYTLIFYISLINLDIYIVCSIAIRKEAEQLRHSIEVEKDRSSNLNMLLMESKLKVTELTQDMIQIKNTSNAGVTTAEAVEDLKKKLGIL